MRLVAVSMVRDEADVIGLFLAHHLPLLDGLLVVDHGSTDGTREALERCATDAGAGCAVRVLGYAGAGWLQSEITTALMRRAFADGADWVLPLDADEFLDVADRADLEARLGGVAAGSAGGVAQFVWRNVAPAAPVPDGPLHPDQDFVEVDGPTSTKVAVSRDVHRRYPHLRIDRGAHALVPAPGMHKFRGQVVGSLWHVPIRSVTQLRRKVDLGLAALDAVPEARGRFGVQLRRIREATDRRDGAAPDLAVLVAAYLRGDDVVATSHRHVRPFASGLVPVPVPEPAAPSRPVVGSSAGSAAEGGTPAADASVARLGPLGRRAVRLVGDEVVPVVRPLGAVADGWASVRARSDPRRVASLASRAVARLGRRRTHQ